MVNIGYIALCHSFIFPYFVHYNRVGWTGINPDVRIREYAFDYIVYEMTAILSRVLIIEVLYSRV